VDEDSGPPSDDENENDEGEQDCDQEGETCENESLSGILTKDGVVCGLRNKIKAQQPERPTEGLTTAIGGLFNSPREMPCVERTESDDPLVNNQVHSRQLSDESYQLEELKCERSSGTSHVYDGGGDALQFAEEHVNPYDIYLFHYGVVVNRDSWNHCSQPRLGGLTRQMLLCCYYVIGSQSLLSVGLFVISHQLGC
jgi:hypothetical protein